ncbi:MAG: polyamine aminopropyltransferase [Candidatus Stahlbacteria bacterium]|nr:polyamine aminopropyltransferase [Candidatus Stahlbacteria bacterium]
MKIVESCQFGKMLVLDDIVQLTEVDEFIYHEMLVHLPLLTHSNPHSVYIAGAGDGGILREVLRHPIERVTMVELDDEVTAACEKYMPIAQKAFQDKRVNLLFNDASVVLKNSKEQYDIILVDSTDPIGKGENLFDIQFYKDAEKCLTPDGLIAVQSGSPIFQPNLLRKVVREFQLLFPIVQVYTAVVPTYPGVYWSLTMGSKKFNPKEIDIA